MSDYTVETINDGLNEFNVEFHGPKESTVLTLMLLFPHHLLHFFHCFDSYAPLPTDGRVLCGCNNLLINPEQNIDLAMSENILVCVILNITTEKIDPLPYKLLKVLNIYVTRNL